MAKIQIKNSFITSSADITISSSMVKFSSGISAKNITGSFSGSIPALTSYYKQGGNSFGTTAILGTNDNQALIFETNASEKVRIDTNGNVGIGTSSPADKLHVIGNVRINGGDILNWSGQAFIQTLGNYDMFFRPNSTLQMILTGNGNIGIGSGFTNPLAKLHVSGSSTSVSAIFNGNVGIGTTSPVAKLSVYTTSPHGSPTGISVAAGTGGANLLARDSGNYHNWFPYTDGFNYYSADSHVFRSSNHLTNYVYINSSGNLGIGTTNPTQRLDLSGSLRIRSAGTYSDPTDNAGFINYDSTGGIFTISARSNGGSTYMAFRTSNSGTGGERMRIINDGNIGIGTSTPSYLLDVYSGNQDVARFYNNQTTFGFILGSTANTLFTNLLWTTSTGNAQFFKNRSNTSWGGADSFNFYTSNGGFAWHPAGVANAMYLTTSGNLGIGSTSPTSAASFNKVVEAYDATSLSYQVNSGGTYKAEFGISSAGGWLGTSTTHDMRLVSNGTERMRITSGGNVGIGTTSPASLLQVGGSSGATATPTAITFDNTFRNAVGGNTSLKIYLYKSGGETYGFGLNNAGGIEYHVGASGGGSAYHAFYTETTEKVRINSAGNLGIGTTSPTARLHISSSSNDGLAQFKIEGVNAPSTFNWASTFINSALGSSRNYISLIGQALSSRNSGYIGFNHSGTSGSTSNFLTFGLYGVDNILNINGSGNVGIGTTSPNAKLQVVGNVRATSFTGSFSGSVVGSNMFVQGGNSFGTTAILGTSDNQALILETNNTEKLRITTGGNLLIGNSSGTGYRLNVKSPFASAVGGAYIEVGEFNQKTLVINNTNPSVSSNLFEAQKSGSAVFVINSAGNVGIGTTSPATLLHVDTSGADARIRVSAGTNTVQGGMIANSGTSLIYAGSITNHGFSLRTNDTDRVRIDTSGNVGIGTTTVATKFVVAADATDSDVGQLRVIGSTSNAKMTNVGYHTTNNYGFIQALIAGTGYSPLSIQPNGGNVGIGTTSPGYKLDVYGDLRISGSTSTIGTFKSSASSCFISLIDSSGDNVFLGNDDGDFLIQTPTSAYSTKLIVKDDGNVGIGTTSPTTKLAVSDGTTIAQVNPSSGVAYFGTVNNYPMALSVNSSEKVRILNDGNVGIGTTSPSRQLELYGNNSDAYIQLTRTSTAYQSTLGFKTGATDDWLIRTGDNSTSNLLFYSYGTSTYVMTILRASGNVGIGTTSPGTLLQVHGSNPFVRINNTITGDHGIKISYNNSDTHGLHLLYNANSALSYIDNTYPTSSGQVYGDIYFRQNVAGTMTTRMTIKADGGGNVGIGTTAPGYKLDVNGTIGLSGSPFASYSSNYNRIFEPAGNVAIYLGNATDPGNYYDNTTHNFRSRAGGTNYVIINSSGNVGIGTTSPSALLHVYNGSSHFEATSTGAAVLSSGVYALQIAPLHNRITTAGTYYGGIAFNHLLNFNGGTTYNGAPQAWIGTRLQDTTGSERDYLVFATKPGTGTSGAGNDIPIERMCIDRDGLVGIGTTSPGNAKLHIYDATYSFTRCTNTTNAGHYVDIGANSSGQSFLFSYGAYPVLIGTNGSERIRVDSGGNVGIGTSSPSTYTTQLAIETSQTRAIMAFNTALADTGTLFGLGFGYAMSTYNSAYLGFYKASSGSSSNRLFFSLWNQDNILNILGSGNVGVGTTAPISKLNTYASGSNLSVFRVDGGNGTLFEVTDQLSGSLFSVNDVSGLPLLEVFSNNRIVAGKYNTNALVISGSSVGIGTATPAYKLQVNGSFGATTKSFVIDHPTKQGKKLVYGSLESPYHGIRLTGRNVLIDGECKVQLPDYIYKLARSESVNIQITPIKCGKVIYVDEISVPNNYFVVKYDKSMFESYKNYEFFWDFTATRNDVDELIVEQ